MVYLLFLLLIISIFLEGTVTALPLVFVCIICLTIFLRSPVIFILAFFAGIILDAFALRSLGGTSIFLLTTVLMIFLYQRKYEINSYPFVFIASFLGSLLFSIIFTYQHVFLLAGINALIAVVVFACIRLVYIKIQDTKVYF